MRDDRLRGSQILVQVDIFEIDAARLLYLFFDTFELYSPHISSIRSSRAEIGSIQSDL